MDGLHPATLSILRSFRRDVTLAIDPFQLHQFLRWTRIHLLNHAQDRFAERIGNAADVVDAMNH